MDEEIKKLEERITALEIKIEEIINAYNRHRHTLLITDDSGLPTYPVKKKEIRK